MNHAQKERTVFPVFLPSGKRLQFAIENGPVEIVDLPDLPS